MKTAQEIIKNLLDLQCNPDKFDVLESVNILDCAKEYLATGGWLPISDAPKDGTELILLGEYDTKGDDDLEHYCPKGIVSICGLSDRSLGGRGYWRALETPTFDSYEDSKEMYFIPTHFQYLPQPPKEKNNEIFM